MLRQKLILYNDKEQPFHEKDIREKNKLFYPNHSNNPGADPGFFKRG